MRVLKSIERVNKRLAQRQEAYEKHKAKLRELYHYAKSKGFSAPEAQVLSFENKGTIDKFAAEREAGTNSNG